MDLYNIEAEQAYIGAVLVNNAAMFELIQPDHFVSPLHQKIYSVVTREISEGKTVNPVTIGPILNDDPDMQEAGGNKYIARLATSAISILHAAEYAEIVIGLWKRREVVRVARQAMDDAHEDNNLDEALNAITGNFHQIAQAAERGHGLVHVTKAAGKVIDRLYSEDEGVSGITTGLRALDAATGMFKPGQSIVLAGRPGMGKTAVGLAIAKGAAKAGHPVAFFSQEMTADELCERLLSDVTYSGESSAKYSEMNTSLDPYVKEKLKGAAERMKDLPLYIEDQANMSVSGIFARCQELQHRLKATGQKLDMVVIDYLGLMKVAGKYSGNRVQEVGELSRSIKQLAKNLGCPVVTLAQLNRGNEQRENKRPTLSDLRDSGEIEQDADKVIFVYREQYYLEKDEPQDPDKREAWQAKLEQVTDKMELIIDKQRNGPTGTRYFFCSMGNNAIRDLQYG